MLSVHEQRVLGAMIEKEIATPEAYPLSLNALVNACNQRSSRDPVMDLTEDEAREALDGLEARGLISRTRDSRVPKFEHRARTVFNLRRDETAVLCLLLLRGPQTAGELRGRADRLHSFEDLASVQATLDRLAGRVVGSEESEEESAGPLAMMLARQPGSRESRFAHLLGGELPDMAASSRQPPPHSSKGSEGITRIEQLETEVAELRRRLNAIEDRIVQI